MKKQGILNKNKFHSEFKNRIFYIMTLIGGQGQTIFACFDFFEIYIEVFSFIW